MASVSNSSIVQQGRTLLCELQTSQPEIISRAGQAFQDKQREWEANRAAIFSPVDFERPTHVYYDRIEPRIVFSREIAQEPAASDEYGYMMHVSFKALIDAFNPEQREPIREFLLNKLLKGQSLSDFISKAVGRRDLVDKVEKLFKKLGRQGFLSAEEKLKKRDYQQSIEYQREQLEGQIAIAADKRASGVEACWKKLESIDLTTLRDDVAALKIYSDGGASEKQKLLEGLERLQQAKDELLTPGRLCGKYFKNASFYKNWSSINRSDLSKVIEALDGCRQVEEDEAALKERLRNLNCEEEITWFDPPFDEQVQAAGFEHVESQVFSQAAVVRKMEPCRSWVREVLLRSKTLDWMVPSVEKVKLSTENNHSIVQEIAAQNRLLESRGITKASTSTVAAAVRVAYVALICLSIAPAGMVVNGWDTIKEASFYLLFAEDKEGATDKVNSCFKAFQMDSLAFISGLLGSVTLLGPVVIMLVPLLVTQLSVALVGSMVLTGVCSFMIGMSLLGGSSPSHRIAYLAGQDSRDRSNLYLAMELRQKFGYVDSHGDLLNTEAIDVEGTNIAALLFMVGASLVPPRTLDSSFENCRDLMQVIDGLSNELKMQYIIMWEHAESELEYDGISSLIRFFI